MDERRNIPSRLLMKVARGLSLLSTDPLSVRSARGETLWNGSDRDEADVQAPVPDSPERMETAETAEDKIVSDKSSAAAEKANAVRPGKDAVKNRVKQEKTDITGNDHEDGGIAARSNVFAPMVNEKMTEKRPDNEDTPPDDTKPVREPLLLRIEEGMPVGESFAVPFSAADFDKRATYRASIPEDETADEKRENMNMSSRSDAGEWAVPSAPREERKSAVPGIPATSAEFPAGNALEGSVGGADKEDIHVDVTPKVKLIGTGNRDGVQVPVTAGKHPTDAPGDPLSGPRGLMTQRKAASAASVMENQEHGSDITSREALSSAGEAPVAIRAGEAEPRINIGTINISIKGKRNEPAQEEYWPDPPSYTDHIITGDWEWTCRYGR